MTLAQLNDDNDRRSTGSLTVLALPDSATSKHLPDRDVICLDDDFTMARSDAAKSADLSKADNCLEFGQSTNSKPGTSATQKQIDIPTFFADLKKSRGKRASLDENSNSVSACLKSTAENVDDDNSKLSAFDLGLSQTEKTKDAVKQWLISSSTCASENETETGNSNDLSVEFIGQDDATKTTGLLKCKQTSNSGKAKVDDARKDRRPKNTAATQRSSNTRTSASKANDAATTATQRSSNTRTSASKANDAATTATQRSSNTCTSASKANEAATTANLNTNKFYQAMSSDDTLTPTVLVTSSHADSSIEVSGEMFGILNTTVDYVTGDAGGGGAEVTSSNDDAAARQSAKKRKSLNAGEDTTGRI